MFHFVFRLTMEWTLLIWNGKNYGSCQMGDDTFASFSLAGVSWLMRLEMRYHPW